MMVQSVVQVERSKYKQSAVQRFLILLFAAFVSFYLTLTLSSQLINTTAPGEDSSAPLMGKSVLKNPGSFLNPDSDVCHLPNLKPLDKSIAPYVKKVKRIDCSEDSNSPYGNLFRIDRNGTLILASNISNASNSCCYVPFQGRARPRYSKKCVSIKGTTNEIVPYETEFVAIYCHKKETGKKEDGTVPDLVDLLHFTPIKPKVEAKAEKRMRSTKIPSKPKYNVLIFGIDAMSHLNFQRTMPATRAHLISQKAEFLNGYTKVADNTFPNIVPVLTGLDVTELEKLCWPTTKSYFDSCPFIWKNFSAAGYRTSYAEDAVWMSIFDYLKKGFETPPTDYWLNDFMRTAAKEIGHHKFGNAKLCYGPRLAFSILLDNLEKTAFQMGMDRRYFQFTWATSISHDDLNNPGMVDDELLSSLKFLNDGGYLNKTVLVLTSDHGIRFGKIRETFQGKIEESMPFLYVLFPPEFRDSYPLAINNFITNRQRLTTPFDLHEMLKDLLDLDSIVDQEIEERQEILNHNIYPRGISLFLEIPRNRSCEDAAIKDSYCVCHSMTSIPIDAPGVSNAAEAAVQHINGILQPFKQCAELQLLFPMSAHSVKLKPKSSAGLVGKVPVEYNVIFRTAPGDAVFEATMVTSTIETLENSDSWDVAGDISRVDSYGNQSHCVDDYSVTKYCYC